MPFPTENGDQYRKIKYGRDKLSTTFLFINFIKARGFKKTGKDNCLTTATAARTPLNRGNAAHIEKCLPTAYNHIIFNTHKVRLQKQ